MKKIVIISMLIFNSFLYADDSKVNVVTDATKSVVSGFVKFGKDLLEGADEGVDEGRKTGQSQDDAIIVDNGNDLEKNLELKFLGVKKESETLSYVELGFKNANNKPVRLINLRESENVIVIDTDGYATNLAANSGNPSNFTIPSKAGKKQKFYFEIAVDTVKEIRIMGKTISK